MSTVVYLSNQSIQIITGTRGSKKITINDCCILDAPEGSIINGTVTDINSLADCLKEFWQANSLNANDVYLVVNSNKIISKNLDVPAMSERKERDFIRREFADIEAGTERVYGSISFKPDSKMTIVPMNKLYVESATKEFVETYIELFKLAGIGLKGMYSGEGALISLTASTIAITRKTFVMEVADNMNLTTILWVNGRFYYYNSTRCFSVPGTESYALDVGKSVSQIIQFMQANQIEYELEEIVLAGISSGNVPLYRNAIESHGINTPVSVFADTKRIKCNGNYDIQRTIQAVSGLGCVQKRQNFLVYYSGMHKARKETDAGTMKKIGAVAAVTAVMLLGFGGTFAYKVMRNNKLTELKDYNESPAVISQASMYDALLARNTYISGQYYAINEISDNLDTYPYCSAEVRNIIGTCAKGYADVDIESFNSDTGVVTMVAKAENVDLINQFIKRLTDEDIFNNIDYTGYAFEEDTELWNIHVMCILSESAGKQGGEADAD